MKSAKILIIAGLFTAAMTACSGDGSTPLGLGGPGVSTPDSAEQALDVTAKDTSSVTAPDENGDKTGVDAPEDLSNDAGAQVQPAAEEPAAEQGDTNVADTSGVEKDTVLEIPATPDTAGAGEEINTEQVLNDEADLLAENSGEAVTAPEFQYSLDISAGRWYQTSPGGVTGISKADYDRKNTLIKEYRDRIRELRRSDTKGQGDEKGKGAEKGKGDEKGKGNEKESIADVSAQIREYMDKIKALRDEIGYGDETGGIHTYWANENLYLRVRNVPEEGWYRLRITAKNQGKLPAWYDYFNVSVINDTRGANVGGIFIKASDNKYRRGSLLVYLPRGNTDLNLLWTNDAYEKDRYDANIQIQNVTLAKNGGGRVMHSLVRRAHQYSEAIGRFFWDKKGAYTYWANQTLGFNFPNLEQGKYRVIITAKNYGDLPLPKGYANFEVSVDADGTGGTANIPASERNWEKGFAVLDLTGGNTNIYCTWLNDSYREGAYDANIHIKNIKLQRIGDSERSALAAYLLGTTGRHKGAVAGGLMLLLMALAVLVLYNRRRARLQI